MSSIHVPVATIDEVLPHPDPETVNLELVHVLGWQLVSQKGTWKKDELVVYVPPDSMLPLELSEALNITKYLSNGRLRCIKLRGEPSFGMAMPLPEGVDWEVGQNVADYYGITKYIPPLRLSSDDVEEDTNPFFIKYTEIENLRNYPDVFVEGEPVAITEKIHGCSTRVGMIDGEWMAGSLGLQRRKPDGDDNKTSLFWHPLSLPSVNELIEQLSQTHRHVIIFGEVYGPLVHSYHYGLDKTKLGYAAFDIMCDGKYINYDDFYELCVRFDVPMAPSLGIHPYSLAVVQAASRGPSLLGGQPVREGVVIKPVIERTHPRVGRVAMKYLSDAFLLKADKSDYTEL